MALNVVLIAVLILCVVAIAEMPRSSIPITGFAVVGSLITLRNSKKHGQIQRALNLSIRETSDAQAWFDSLPPVDRKKKSNELVGMVERSVVRTSERITLP